MLKCTISLHAPFLADILPWVMYTNTPKIAALLRSVTRSTTLADVRIFSTCHCWTFSIGHQSRPSSKPSYYETIFKLARHYISAGNDSHYSFNLERRIRDTSNRIINPRSSDYSRDQSASHHDRLGWKMTGRNVLWLDLNFVTLCFVWTWHDMNGRLYGMQ